MTIVSTREFRANQSHYFGLAKRGEHVVLKSRLGHFRLMPEPLCEEDNNERFVEGFRRSLQDWKDYLAGNESKMLSWEEMMNELRD